MNIFRKVLKLVLQRKKTKMEQEIFEQPDIIFDLIRKYINKDYTINIELPHDIDDVVLIASGSSYNSASIAAEFIRKNVLMNAVVKYSSELILEENMKINTKTLYIFISQSGETSDTNTALNKINKYTDKTLAITNVKNSTLWNSAQYKILTHAGNEKAIASTKTATSQLFCLLLTAVKLMDMHNISYINIVDELLCVPDYIKNVLQKHEDVKKYSYMLENYDNSVILGSGLFYPLAKEGALKIKETSYINVTAYPTGEFLHGHIAILNKKCAAIFLVNSNNIQTTIDVLMKINKNYKTDILLISDLPVNNADRNEIIHIESKSDLCFLFSSMIILQLLAFETAVLLDRNVDFPEGLTKVV